MADQQTTPTGTEELVKDTGVESQSYPIRTPADVLSGNRRNIFRAR
jgi:hypothetical protein